MAKRVNTRFLIILTAVFACLIAAAVVAKVTIFRKDPRAHEIAGDKEFKEANYKKAVEYYRFAIAASKNANGLLVKTGDALNNMVADDPQNLYAARAAWSQALANDPNYEPALQRLLDSYWEQIDLMPMEGEVYARVRETAERLAAVRPGDVKTAAKAHIAVIRPWLEGIPVRKLDVDNSVKALEQLAARDKTDADVPFYIAQAKLKDSREKRERERAKSDDLARQAAATFDAALADPPKDAEANAAMQIRAFQIYSRLDQIERANIAEAERRSARDVLKIEVAANPDAAAAGPQGPKNYRAKAEKALAAALEASKSLPVDGTLYFDIHAQAADYAMRQKRVADAEKIFEDVLAKRPDDQRARLVYAKLLSSTPAKRDKAVEILSREVKVARLVGPRGFEANQLRIQTLIELVGTRIDQARALAAVAPTSPDAASSTAKQRQDLLAEIRSDMGRLEPLLPGESVSALRLRARLLQLEGKYADAIKTYQRAVTLMEGTPQERKDYDLINELAVAYLQAGQTGQAKTLLEQIIRQYDWYAPARLQMAQLLVNENKIEDAKRHMREAEKQLGKMPGDSPDYARVRAEFDRIGLAIMKASGDERLNESFAKLPEASRVEKFNKALVGRQLGKNEEAVRIAAALLKEDPKDLQALEVLLGALLAGERREEALAALDAAVAANPDKADRLQPVRERLRAAIELTNATPQQIYERRRQLIENEPASPARSIKLADLEREYGEYDKAEEILLALHSENAADVQVMTRLFDLNVTQSKWDKAKGYLDKLVAANADEANGLLFQYRFAMSQKNVPEGLRLAKALAQSRPEFDVSWVAYGQALQADRRYAEAIKQYTAARQRKPHNFEALRGMVECHVALTQTDAAREVLTEARALFPNDTTFRDLELYMQLSYGDPFAVVTQREQYYRERPEIPANWLKLAEAYREAAKSKAASADPAKKADMQAKARDLLARGVARFNGDARFVAQFVAQQAELALESGDFAGGEKLLQAFAARPEHQGGADAQLLLADYYVRAHKAAEAEGAYRGAVQKWMELGAAAAKEGKKDDVAAAEARANDIRLQLSGLLAQQAKFEDALKVLDEAPGAAADRRLFNQRLSVLILAGRRGDAEQALLDAIKQGRGAAEDPGLQMMLVRVNFDGGRYDDALNRVDKILKNDPENLEAHFYRGQILLRRPQPDLAGAINELTVVRKADPLNAATRILIADAYRLQGDTPKAVRELEEALRNNPLSRELRLRLMDYWGMEGSRDHSAVLKLARDARLIPELKNDPVWAWRESRVYAERRDWPRAIQAIEDAAKLAPADPQIVREFQSVLIQSENYQQVLDQTEPLVKQNRAPWWVFMNRASARHGLKDAAGAMNEFNLALTAAGGDNAAVENIVKVMTSTVGKDKALEQVMARADSDVRWKLLAAALHSIYKDWDQAVKMLDEVQAHFDKLTPRQQSQALRISGPLYQLARPPQLDKAKTAYEKLLKLEPNDLFALNNLATLLIDDSLVPQPQQAREYSQKAFDQVKRAQPFPAAIWDTHGWVLVNCGGKDVDTGIDILQRVVRQTALPEAHYHLGEAFLKKQDPKKALEALQVAARTISTAPTQGIAVSPDLEKKIQSATERAKELQRSQGGGNAEAR